MRNSSGREFCAGVFLCGSEMGRAFWCSTMTAERTNRFGGLRGVRRRGPPTESGVAVVEKIGSGKESSQCGTQPRALECERGLRCRLEGGATKAAGALAEGAQDRCASGTVSRRAELQVCGSGTLGGSAHGGGATCILMGRP